MTAPPHHRILIVDDDQGVRNSLARVLRIKGHEVTTASDGYEALAMAKASKPDLLILDIRMPGMDGIETLHHIRQTHPSIAAIFMTAFVVSNQLSAARHFGGVSVIPKPLDIDSLSELVSHSFDDGE